MQRLLLLLGTGLLVGMFLPVPNLNGTGVFAFIEPQTAYAHRSGCHRWHTCPSDTGSYQMEFRTDGSTVQYCGSSMYMGSDNHCHYYTTPTSSIPSYSTPSISTPSYSLPSISLPSISTPTYHSCISYGLGATYNYLTEKCECSYGYRANSTGTRCISRDDYCQELDWNSEYDILKDACVCKTGYKVGASGKSCVLDFTPSTPSVSPSYDWLNEFLKTYSNSSSTTTSSNPSDAQCKARNGEGAESSGYGCRCLSSYHWNDAKTECLPGSPTHVQDEKHKRDALMRQARKIKAANKNVNSVTKNVTQRRSRRLLKSGAN